MAPDSEAQTAPPDSVPNFEQALGQLEQLVAQLESGDLPLDQALACFERGVRLTRECQTALSAAQQKVHLLLQRGEGFVTQEFDPAGGEAEPGPAGPVDSP